jgi:Methyltransferase domain
VPDGIAEGVYASHVLEHLSYDDFWIALRNTHRLLKPGGIFRLVVPDLEIRARKYLNQLDDSIADANVWFMETSNLDPSHVDRGMRSDNPALRRPKASIDLEHYAQPQTVRPC